MKIIPARILKIHEKVVPAVIHEDHNYTIPAIIQTDRYFILRDFLYRCKPVLEYELDLSEYSSIINFKFIYSNTDQYMVMGTESVNNDLGCKFTIYINRYTLDKDFGMLNTTKYLENVFKYFSRIMREIYQYINIYSYGYSVSESIECDCGIEDSDSLLDDIDYYEKYIYDMMEESFLISKLIQCVIINNLQNNVPEFDLVHWIYFVFNSSSVLMELKDSIGLDMIISYQNWYMDHNQLYLIDYNLDRDTCIIKFNCNIRLGNNIESILNYTKSLFISSIMDVANEVLNDSGMSEDYSIFASTMFQIKNLIELHFSRELETLFEYYIVENV